MVVTNVPAVAASYHLYVLLPVAPEGTSVAVLPEQMFFAGTAGAEGGVHGIP